MKKPGAPRIRARPPLVVVLSRFESCPLVQYISICLRRFLHSLMVQTSLYWVQIFAFPWRGLVGECWWWKGLFTRSVRRATERGEEDIHNKRMADFCGALGGSIFFCTLRSSADLVCVLARLACRRRGLLWSALGDMVVSATSCSLCCIALLTRWFSQWPLQVVLHLELNFLFKLPA